MDNSKEAKLSNIHNFQRRALESLIVKGIASSFTLNENQRYFVDNKEIWLLGISRGIGACSDLKDMNIAVFGYKRPLAIQGKPNFLERCAAGAVIRGVGSYRVADNLKVIKEIVESIDFTAEGTSEPYRRTIC